MIKKALLIAAITLLAFSPQIAAQTGKRLSRSAELEVGYVQNGGYASVSSGLVVGTDMYLGVGTGLQVSDLTQDNKKVSVMVPLFLYARFAVGGGEWKFLTEVRGGLESDLSSFGTGCFVRPAIGVKCRRIGIKVGYEFLRMRYREPIVSYPDGSDKVHDPYFITGYGGLEWGAGRLTLGVSYSF